MTSYRESIMNSGKTFYNQLVSGSEYVIEHLPTVPSTSTSMGYIFSVLPPLGGATPFAVFGFGFAATLVGHKCANSFANFMRTHSKAVEFISPKIDGESKKYIKTEGWIQFGAESLKKIVCTAATEATSAVITTGLGAAAGAVIAAATATAFTPAMISAAALTALVWASVKTVQYGVLALKEAIKVVVKGVVLIFTSIKDLFVWLFKAIKRCSKSFKNKAASNAYVKQFEQLQKENTALTPLVKKSQNPTENKATFADLRVETNKDNKITKVYINGDSTDLLNLNTFTEQMKEGVKVYRKDLKNYKEKIENIKVNEVKFKKFKQKNSKIVEPIRNELAQINKIYNILDHILETK